MIPTNPKVSVLTSTYNRPEMLQKCLASMQAQTDPDWEHLIVDDGSSNPAVRGVLDAAERDPRVRVFHANHSGDLPARRWNELIDQARGAFICLLDDDNEKLPLFIERMSSVLTGDPRIDLVTCGMVVFQDGIRSEHRLNVTTTAETLRTRNSVDSGAFMVRADALERIGYFPMNIRTGEDWMMIRRAVSCLNVKHLDDLLTVYLVHGGARMWRRGVLGGDRDNAVIRTATWKHPYGVRVHAPRSERLDSTRQAIVDGIVYGITLTPWIAQGQGDSDIVIHPGRLDPEDLWCIAARSPLLIVVIVGEDDVALVQDLTRRCREVWVVSNRPESIEAYRPAIGPRTIVCTGFSGYPSRTQVARVINCVRSHRPEAVIP